MWKQIDGWPYEVSDGGEVRRIGREESLKPWVTNGYLYVQLCDMGRKKSTIAKIRQRHRARNMPV